MLLVDNKNVFQAYKLSSKQISKICKFELDCGGTSLTAPPVSASFQREQIVLTWIYGRMVILFVNEAKGQLHLLSLASPAQSDDMEQVSREAHAAISSQGTAARTDSSRVLLSCASLSAAFS